MNRIGKGKGLTTVCVVCNKKPLTEKYNPTCSKECQNNYRGVPN